MHACRYIEESSLAAMLAAKMPTLDLKSRGHVTRSPKQGYQWPHKKDFVLQFFFLMSSRFLENNSFQLNDSVNSNVSFVALSIDLAVCSFK